MSKIAPMGRCPGCGVELPDSAEPWDSRSLASEACHALYGEVAGFESQHIVELGRWHQLLVDTDRHGVRTDWPAPRARPGLGWAGRPTCPPGSRPALPGVARLPDTGATRRADRSRPRPREHARGARRAPASLGHERLGSLGRVSRGRRDAHRGAAPAGSPALRRIVVSDARAWPRWTRSWPAARRNVRS